MPIMEWSDSFELGIKEFDDHHRHLVGQLNIIFDDFMCDESPEALGTVLDELIDYATYHFAAEEYWMKENEYPRLKQHSDEHEKFSTKVVEIQKDFHDGKMFLSLEILNFLTNWLMDHILKTDADYASFAKGTKQMKDKCTLFVDNL